MAFTKTAGVVYGTPAVVLSTTADAGSTQQAIRVDGQLIAFDGVDPSSVQEDTASSPGVAPLAARRDHVHGTTDNLVQIVTGSYSGDAAASQAITGVNVLASLIFISKRDTAATAYASFNLSSTTIFDNNASGYVYSWGGSVTNGQFVAGKLIAIGTDGFTVSDSVITYGRLNGAGNTYDYTIIGY